ncbi:hypothetical protein I6F53_19405 [Pseudoalteromonas sp. SWN29]|uniref:hypothetical protein n=1 Tax=Pseudoalteromonas sp. SWN29 TaxID=2792064 RepID=UPI0018CCD0E0|nr:hypothetical protein [Pseudoalteromonas sp. SWN29]MBH0029124.1 hypothetical protein [Pseudoalteromonas sp. SWN29]
MRKLTITIFFLLIVGCSASSGTNFTIGQANLVENGMTREQVIQIMGGNPYSIQDQGKTFVWSFAKFNGFTGANESRAARFNFDEEGLTYAVPEGGVYGDISKYQDNPK